MLLSISDMPSALKTLRIVSALKIQKVSADPIELLDDTTIRQAWCMIKTCLQHDGIGLAANQVGINKLMFVAREDENNFRLIANPVWAPATDDSVLDIGLEGCLSIPGESIPVERHPQIVASWLGCDSETLDGSRSRLFQHETDHLLGLSILEVGKVNRADLRRITSKLKKLRF